MSLKRIQAIGNIVADAKLSNMSTGKSAINFTVANNDVYIDKNGDRKENTMYFECVIFKDSDSTSVLEHIKKGMKVYVEGSPEINMFERKSKGETVAQIKIIVKRIEFVSYPKESKPEAKKDNKDSKNDNDLPY